MKTITFIFILVATTFQVACAQKKDNNQMKHQKDFQYIAQKLSAYREKFTEIQPETNINEHPVFSQWVSKEQYFQAEESQIVLTILYCKDDYFAAALADQVYIRMTERENFTWGIVGNMVYEINGTNVTEMLDIEHLANHIEGISNFENEWKVKLLFASYVLTQQPDLVSLKNILPIGFSFVKEEDNIWYFQDYHHLPIEIYLDKEIKKITYVKGTEKKENEKLFINFLHNSDFFQYWGSEHNAQYYKQLDRKREFPNLYYLSDNDQYFTWNLSDPK